MITMKNILKPFIKPFISDQQFEAAKKIVIAVRDAYRREQAKDQAKATAAKSFIEKNTIDNTPKKKEEFTLEDQMELLRKYNEQKKAEEAKKGIKKEAPKEPPKTVDPLFEEKKATFLKLTESWKSYYEGNNIRYLDISFTDKGGTLKLSNGDEIFINIKDISTK
jgi:chromosome condensin MukBEF ATPase and DNA-binding subunit MukB